MADANFQKAERLVTLLSVAIKGMALYPESHPSVLQPLQGLSALCGEFLRKAPECRVGLLDGLLFLEEHLFIVPTAAVAELAQILDSRDIEGFSLFRGLTPRELAVFVGLLSQKGLTADGFAKRLQEEGVTHIRLKAQEEDEQSPAEEMRGAYNQALSAVRDVFSEVNKGRIPNCQRLLGVVEEMVATTIQDPPALLGLAMIKDYDDYTFNHCVNVGILAMALGAFMGMGKEELKALGTAGMLHDIGKTRVSRDLLNKPGKYTAAEFAEMKKHSEFGAEIVQSMDGVAPMIARAVLGHHVQFNRGGYPEWACGEDFGVMAEILAVTDGYDALTTQRVYQQPHTPKAAIDRLRLHSGTYYNTDIVNKFVTMMGAYPVGSLVRLDTNETAVVLRPNPKDSEAPTVKIIMDGYGELLPEPRVEKLVREDGSRYASIVTVIDPVLKNIDVIEHIT